MVSFPADRMFPGRWLGIARSTGDEFTYNIIPEHKDKHCSVPIMRSVLRACAPDLVVPNSSAPRQPPSNDPVNLTDVDDGNLATATLTETADSPTQSHVDPGEEPPSLDAMQEGSAPDHSDDNWAFDDGLRALLDQNQGKEFFLNEGLATLGACDDNGNYTAMLADSGEEHLLSAQEIYDHFSRTEVPPGERITVITNH